MRSESRFEVMTERSGIGRVLEAAGDVIAANPAVVGGTTAFAVAMAFFSANALYFQDQSHPSALFSTRPEVQSADRDAPKGTPEHGQNVTRLVLRSTDLNSLDERRIPVPPMRKPDPVMTVDGRQEVPARPSTVSGDGQLATIQDLLGKLGYYKGTVDGLQGPMTAVAIEEYKDRVGLRGIALSNDQLITSLRNNLDITAAIPSPRPEASRDDLEEAATTVAELLTSNRLSPDRVGPAKIPSAEVVKVQAALKAFGNADIVVDGIAGGQTEEAIREFQTLFRIPVTGKIDGPLLDKMRDVGLIR